jgi:hypothetical protein
LAVSHLLASKETLDSEATLVTVPLDSQVATHLDSKATLHLGSQVTTHLGSKLSPDWDKPPVIHSEPIRTLGTFSRTISDNKETLHSVSSLLTLLTSQLTRASVKSSQILLVSKAILLLVKLLTLGSAKHKTHPQKMTATTKVLF